VSPTAIREIMLLKELCHENVVRLDSVHINRADPSLSLAFDYAEHDLYEMIWHHRDRMQGGQQLSCLAPDQLVAACGWWCELGHARLLVACCMHLAGAVVACKARLLLLTHTMRDLN
jgi:hypothetical protein